MPKIFSKPHAICDNNRDFETVPSIHLHLYDATAVYNDNGTNKTFRLLPRKEQKLCTFCSSQNINGFTGNGWESTGSDFRCQHYHCSIHQQLMQPTDHSITVYLQLTNVHTNQIFCSNANSQHINISCHQSPMLSTLATGTKLTEYGHRNQRRYHYKSVDE